MPDHDLVEQCRKLYAQHKDALDLIYRYGEVDSFESAANSFFENHTELKRLAVRSGRAVFLPIALLEIVPEINGTNWYGQSRPIAFWFNLRPDNRFGLVIEVGPFADGMFKREAMAKALLDYFKNKNKIYPKYTRVYSEYVRLTEDQVSSSEEMQTAMNGLYDSVMSKYLVAVTNILMHFFKERSAAER